MLACNLRPSLSLLALLSLAFSHANDRPLPEVAGPVAGRSGSALAPGEASPPLRAEWLAQLEQGSARAEYSWSSSPEGVYLATNRSQGLRCRLGADGIEVVPRATEEGGEGAAWSLVLATVGFGYEGDVRPLGDSRLLSRAERVERQASPLCEWYVNDERGIEQGWTIPLPPPGGGDRLLSIELAVVGLQARVAADGLSAGFEDGAGQLRLRYQGLAAWDAAGRALAARLVPIPGGLALRLEDEGALYPITVDPVLSGPVWTAEGNRTFAHFGMRVCGAGDVNADGFDDLLVGAPYFGNGQLVEGRAYLYLGSASGPSSTPAWIAESDQAHANFGISVSGAGDVNGDGFDDVIVGAAYFDNDQPDEGRVYLYLGSASGPSSTPDWTAESDQSQSWFGYSASGAGDVNGDGFDDLLVGAPYFDNGQVDEGRVYLYLGAANGPSPNPDWTAESDQGGSIFGVSVSAAGDVNGDGFDDLLIGAPYFDNGQTDEGRAYLYLGSASGPSSAPDWTAESDQDSAFLGYNVSAARDVNGDGFDDLLVGVKRLDIGHVDEGGAFLYFGSASGPSSTPSWTAVGNQLSADFGDSVSGAGDVDGDGFDDLLVGAWLYDNGQADEGRAYLYRGSASGPSAAPDWISEGDQEYANFGRCVSGAGDVNGDGLDDVIVGASAYDNGEMDEGRVFLYTGRAPQDCNGNGIDDCDDIAAGTSQDCNANAIPDECDIAGGTSLDENGNGVPDECETVGTKYCIATANSTGAPADIRAWGSASAAAADLLLVASPVPNQFGIFFHGGSQALIAFGNGFLCTTGGITRGAVIQASGNVASYGYDNSDAAHSLTAFVGTTRNFQYWFRDPMGGGASFNTSNGISIAIQP